MKTKSRFNYIQNPITKLYTKVDVKAGRILKTDIKKKPNVIPLESSTQKEFIRWFDLQYPHIGNLLFHPANGGTRNVREAVNLKAQGVRKGVSDIILLVPRGTYHGLVMELKRKGCKPTKEQLEFLHALQAKGYCTAWHDDLEEAITFVDDYMKLPMPQFKLAESLPNLVVSQAVQMPEGFGLIDGEIF